LTGALPVIVWNEAFARCAASVEQGRVVAIAGWIDRRGDMPRLIALNVSPLLRSAL